MTPKKQRSPLKQQQSDAPEPKPGVIVGDELYVHHKGQPCTGRVAAHGRHGVTVEIEGQHHQVRWEKVLGHKKRIAQHLAVVDQGEDGMLVQDAGGQRHYVATPNESKEDPFVAKAQRPLLLFMKAGSVVNRPGLSKKQITDKTGRQQTKWVRTNKDQPAQRRPAAHDAEAGAHHGYGTHNLQPGDKVMFAAGDFKGGGHIVGKPGADGAHVKDSSGRVHQVRWAEITGHDKNGGADKPALEHQVAGEQKPVPKESFKATDYARSHDDANATPESILAQFPPDTMDKIKAVQDRLHTVEQTIEEFKKGDNYLPKRQALHREIYSRLMSPERIAAATPAAGELPTFTVLGGRGGSGKSWFKGQVYDPAKAIVLDADEIKGMLPEYEGWNAHQVHEESSDILETMLTVAKAMGLNVVLDATMKTSKSTLARANEFKGAGYRLEAHYMHLPRQEAAKRAVQRFLGKTSRYVPVEVVLANTSNEDTFDQVRAIADRWSFRDNNVPQGSEPVLISESHDSGEPLKKALQPTTLVVWRKR